MHIYNILTVLVEIYILWSVTISMTSYFF